MEMDIARVALALSDPIRLHILDLLAAGRTGGCCSPANPDVPAGVCACDLRPDLGDMGQSKISYHMKLLREAGLIHEQRKGKWVYYTLNPEAVAGFGQILNERYGTAAPPPAVCCDPAPVLVRLEE